MQRAGSNIILRTAPLTAAAAVLWLQQRHHYHGIGSAVVATAFSLQQVTTAYSRPAFCSKRSSVISLCEARPRSSSSRSSAVEEAVSTSSTEDRNRKTAADAYFQTHQKLPRPAVMHAVLSPDRPADGHGILVIGDVHGCYDEMMLLYEKAVQANSGRKFQYVILVGDLCNKGPKSVQVIRHVRKNNNNDTIWLSVRGNHDNGALKAALGDPVRANKERYEWIQKQGLDDEDVAWMAELPYTIRIPAEMLGDDGVDTLIVHAGLVPGVDLDEQSIETMITIREVQETADAGVKKYQYYRGGGGGDDKPHYAWAGVWKGPERVFFGHDARRGLQIDNEWATGFDSGACYGKKLTAILLPSRQIISVDALEEYSPIQSND